MFWNPKILVVILGGIHDDKLMARIPKNKSPDISELRLPSFSDLERIYLIHILELVKTQTNAAKVLGVTTHTIAAMIKKYDIPFDSPKRPRPDMVLPDGKQRDTGKIPTVIRRNHDKNMGQVTVFVTAEERDYYYNLDFLCGTYRDIRSHNLPREDDQD